MDASVMCVLGDCLAPRLLPGDLLYVDHGRPVRVGDVVVVRWQELTLIGQLAEWDGHRWLVGSTAEPLVIGGSAVILGVGHGLFRPL